MRRLATFLSLAAALFVVSQIDFSSSSVRIKSAQAQSVPDVTLNDFIEWDESVGAAGYQIRVLDATNAQVVPPTGVIDVGIPSPLEYAINLLLNGRPAGTHKIQVRAVEAGGTNPTVWTDGELTVNYLGLAPPGNVRVKVMP